MAKNIIKECALCKNVKKLCRSHIIPEYFYKTLYDPKTHSFAQSSSDPTRKDLPRQKGLWEYLLCSDCEGIINDYEKYAIHAFFEKNSIFIENKGEYLLVSGLDYTKFKLFQISLIWRMGISSKEPYKVVNLHKHEDVMRKMLLNGDPGEPHKYASMLIFSPKHYPLKSGLITPIEKGKFDPEGARNICYFHFFGGFIWAYIVSSHTHMMPAQKAILQKDGTMQIELSEKGVDFYINKQIDKLRKAGKL